MLKNVVAIPLDYRPIEVLPPSPGSCEAGVTGAAQGRNRRRTLEVTLKVAIGPQFFQSFCHCRTYKRIVTVRSRPGVVSAVWVTAVTSSPIRALVCKGPSKNPSTKIEKEGPTRNLSEQYGV